MALTIDAQTKKLFISPSQFVKVAELSGKTNYYSIIKDNNDSIIHADYNPPKKPVRLGYVFPDSLHHIKKISWKWRVLKHPCGSDEQKKGKDDSGASIYLIFKNNMNTHIIKYVYSAILPEGTVIRKDPLFPLQRMFIVVASSFSKTGPPETWKQITVDVCSDFERLYGIDCPPLRGIGLMTDGDETKSRVVADYGGFVLTY